MIQTTLRRLVVMFLSLSIFSVQTTIYIYIYIYICCPQCCRINIIENKHPNKKDAETSALRNTTKLSDLLKTDFSFLFRIEKKHKCIMPLH